jgi:hypothetical protein
MFSSGILIASGSFIAIAVLDKVAEDCGIVWLSMTLKIAIPIAALVVSVCFLQSSALMRFIR